jgi:hypothetical protein
MMATAVKKSPELVTPQLRAWRGKKAVRAPHVRKFRQLTIEGGMAFQLRRVSFSGGMSSGGAGGLFFNPRVIPRAHNDKPRHVRKR